MKVNKAYRFRLYPNRDQSEALAKHFGCSRYVWNWFLCRRIDHYADTGKTLTYHDTAAELTQLKRDPEYVWLQEVNAQALQQSLRDLDRAYNNFFSKRARFPCFKSKRVKQSFRVPQSFEVEDGRLRLPKIPGSMKMIVHREIEGEVKHVTVTRTKCGHYYASLCCEVEIPEPEYVGGEIGIDLGLKSLLVTSDGETVAAPQHLRKTERRLKRLQRKMSRRKCGSNGREKARQQLAKQQEKVANQRKDFLHKLSRRLVEENSVIHAEDLNVKGMARNRHLAKSIGDAAWGEFLRQLVYKGEWYGCHLNQIDRFFPSSKRCHVCGWINERLKLSDRTWTCPKCGAVHDRDKNAAKNIEIFGTVGTTGTVTYADGDPVRPSAQTARARSLKSEAPTPSGVE